MSLFKSFKLLAMTATMSMGLILAGCETTDGPLITEDLITKVDDTSPLSVRVKQALRNSPQTASLRFDVTQASDDTVKISGSVSDRALYDEVQRVAGQVEGVRFVINNIMISN